MGNVTACVANSTLLDAGRYQLTWLQTCDRWMVPHFLAPFWLTVFTRSFIVGFLFTHLWESIEILFYSLFGSYVIFAAANDETETQAQILEDILEGFFAGILAKIFLWVFDRAPKLLNQDEVNPDLPPDRGGRWLVGRFLYYLLSYVIAIGPNAIILGTAANYQDRVGRILYGPIMLAGLLLAVAAQYFGWFSWGARDRALYGSQWAEHWLTGILFTLALALQHIWDYLFSAAIQSWVWAGAFALYLFGRKAHLVETHLLRGTRRRSVKGGL